MAQAHHGGDRRRQGARHGHPEVPAGTVSGAGRGGCGIRAGPGAPVGGELNTLLPGSGNGRHQGEDVTVLLLRGGDLKGGGELLRILPGTVRDILHHHPFPGDHPVSWSHVCLQLLRAEPVIPAFRDDPVGTFPVHALQGHHIAGGPGPGGRLGGGNQGRGQGGKEHC